jgi:hypothetical protein
LQTITLTNTKIADVAQKVLMLEGRPYSLKDYPMFVDIFNSGSNRRLLKAGRQVSKTITFSADIVSNAVITPYHPMLYANASSQQTTGFSTSKLDPFLAHSPIVAQNLMRTKNVINNVYNKRFDNFAEVRLTYFSDSADRIRGHTGHTLYVDEVQDMLYDAIIDAEECLSAAPRPRFMYAGTSKSMITPLEFYWQLSTKKEWLIQCDGCNTANVPSLENVGLHGLICKKCGKALNTYEGFWYAFGDTESEYDGYRIPQIILPLHCCNQTKWDNLLRKIKEYPDYKTKNEIMGDPLGEGEALITETMLREMCRPTVPIATKKEPKSCGNAKYMVAGVDWGGGGMTGTSRTVLSIYSVLGDGSGSGDIRKVFGKIFDSGEPSKHLEEIAHYTRLFQVIALYADHGGGNFAMSQLSSMIPQISIVPVMYSDQSAPMRWDEKARRFIVNRTIMIDNFILDIKKKRVRTFRWEEFEPFAKDFLAVKEEIIGEARGVGRRVWRRYPSSPDDSLHSMLYGWLAARVFLGEVDFTV